MLHWVLGIDGGGTGTVARAQRTGGVSLTAYGKAINLYSNTPQQVEETLCHTTGSLFSQMGGPERCAYVVTGAAGLSHAQAGHTIRRGLRKAGYRGPLLVVADMETALWGALPSGTGAILVSGTGSFCYGRNGQDEAWRTGGGGHLLDDEGSAYAIGRDILSHILREWDGRTAPSLLPELLLQAQGISSYQELLAFAYGENTRKQDIAALAPLIATGCAAKDPASLDIAARAGHSLCALATPLLTKLSLENASLSMLGSVLRKNPEVCAAAQSCLQRVHPRLTIAEPAGDSADGALLLAQKMAASPGFHLYSPFLQRFEAEP